MKVLILGDVEYADECEELAKTWKILKIENTYDWWKDMKYDVSEMEKNKKLIIAKKIMSAIHDADIVIFHSNDYDSKYLTIQWAFGYTFSLKKTIWMYNNNKVHTFDYGNIFYHILPHGHYFNNKALLTGMLVKMSKETNDKDSNNYNKSKKRQRT